MEDIQVFSVFEISRHLRQVIESSIEPLYIKGEISNFVHHNSGHMYFNLKDEFSTIRCTYFRGVNSRLTFKPADGQSVICYGKITLYEKGGSYNLNVANMSPAGLGEMQARIDALKKKLQAEGLFEESRKKKLPPYPETIGIVTSPTGAALQDIQNVLNRRFPVQAYVYPALVQGSEAARSLIKGIEYFNREKRVELIIITRGGGSQEDLFCFNDEQLARAIFKSTIPVVSAVGHEIDFSISDFVADLRAPTPSAAAELAVPNKEDLLNYLRSMQQRMMLSAKNSLGNSKHILSENTLELSRYHPQRLWQDYQQRFDMAFLALENIKHLIREPQNELARAADKLHSVVAIQLHGRIDRDSRELGNLQQRLQDSSTRILFNLNQNLKAKADILNHLSPDNMLSKGWALAFKGNELIKSKGQLKKGDELNLRLKDGSARLEVTEDL
jgi:exodeoxyribonuclease VII large subunit